MTARVRIAGLVAFAALAVAAPAQATSEMTDCAHLQSALIQAAAGDTITLDQLCTAWNSGASNGKFTLPMNAAFTLTGLAGSGAGFNGAGVRGPVLYGASAGGTAAGSNLMLSSLTVENDSAALIAPVELHAGGPGGITIQSVTFMNNAASQTYGGGGLLIIDSYCPASSTSSSPIALTGSTFSGNSLTTTTTSAVGGGATVVPGPFNCAFSRGMVVTANVFSSNHASSSSTSSGLLGVVGGGLAVINERKSIEPLTQSGNAFVGNSVTGSGGATTDNYGGGGEWLQGVDLTSRNDSFIANTATGATGAGNSTYGAGLGIVNSSCTQAAHTVAIATNLVSAGNSITGGTPDHVNGAGIYTGCDPGTGSDLTLQDSTVSGNSSVAGSVAGIGGESVDSLTLTNSIDAGNIGGADVGGFNGTGGSITASYSDGCAAGAALPGTGNICAAPALVSATDVHETAASPTIDMGSNALVPSGLTSDPFGSPRELAGKASCRAPFPGPIVDMGAAEYVPVIPPCAPVPKPAPAPSPVLTKANFGNQEITLTTPSPRACTARAKRLPAILNSVKESKGTKVRFSKVAFSIDKGVKHTKFEDKGKGAQKHRVRVHYYRANRTAHHVPVTVHLALSGLKSGPHTLKVVLSYKETKKGRHGKRKTITVTKTLKVKFTVC